MVLSVGIIADRIVQMAVFMLFFEPLRIYAGGYHAKSRRNCFISSFLMLVAVVSAIRFIPDTAVLYVSIAVIFIFGIIIWLIVPVETVNKVFEDIEVKVYRRRARLILAVEILVAAVSILLNYYKLSYIISLGLLCTGLLLLIGYIYNNGVKKNYTDRCVDIKNADKPVNSN